MAGKLHFVPSVQTRLSNDVSRKGFQIMFPDIYTYLANIKCCENDERRAGDEASPLQRKTLLVNETSLGGDFYPLNIHKKNI